MSTYYRKKKLSSEIAQIHLRIPTSIATKIQNSATIEKRSINSQIVYLLEKTYNKK